MHHPRKFLLYVVLACVALLGACGGAKPQEPAAPSTKDVAAEKCPGVYLFASSRYIINLVANEEIVLDPSRHPIPVYCTPDQARKALKAARDSGNVPASMDLRVYQLDGEWRDLVRRDGDKHVLNRPAILLDAVE